MQSLVQVTVHPSQFPKAVQDALVKSLCSRTLNHKFHYDTIKQVQKWLAVTEAYSPWYTDPNCRAVYRLAFKETAAQILAKAVHVIGLGCGTGQKDVQLITLIKKHGQEVYYTPCDSSMPMVLRAHLAASAVIPATSCAPLICDLAMANDLPTVLERIGQTLYANRTGLQRESTHIRLVTFFGMLPNFEPLLAVRTLANAVRPGDTLLLNANLVPGHDPWACPEMLLAQYDNALTRDWLLTVLAELGIETAHGIIRFGFEPDKLGINRIIAKFHFTHKTTIRIGSETFTFKPGEHLQLFFSYRYTADQLRNLLKRQRFVVTAEWFSTAGEEGIFRCQRI